MDFGTKEHLEGTRWLPKLPSSKSIVNQICREIHKSITLGSFGMKKCNADESPRRFN